MSESGQTPRMTCDAFESTLGEFLEGGLTERERGLSERHMAGCAMCKALVADLDHIVHAAGALPSVSPSRDLWPEIESRLEPAILALPARHAPAHQSRSVSWRALASAAALLVTASAGITYTLARNTSATVEVPALAMSNDTVRGNAATASQLAESTAIVLGTASGTAGDSVIKGTDAPGSDQITVVAERAVAADPNAVSTGSASTNAVNTNLVSANALNANLVNAERLTALDTLYGREIAKLRTIAESQLGMLDSSTVNVVRRNLDIIDRAILESRAALESDPNSGFLLEQLDRAYERKVDLLRRLAFL